MINYSQETEFTGNQILVFSTEWCPDCIMLKMYIDQVVNENTNWQFIYIDSDQFPKLAEQHNILGIPSFVALKDGVQIAELISKQAKPKELINEWIRGIDA